MFRIRSSFCTCGVGSGPVCPVKQEHAWVEHGVCTSWLASHFSEFTFFFLQFGLGLVLFFAEAIWCFGIKFSRNGRVSSILLLMRVPHLSCYVSTPQLRCGDNLQNVGRCTLVRMEVGACDREYLASWGNASWCVNWCFGCMLGVVACREFPIVIMIVMIAGLDVVTWWSVFRGFGLTFGVN